MNSAEIKIVTEAERGAVEAALQAKFGGGKPTFAHRRFVQVGALSGSALRWSRWQ